jgi:hypothetical protein
MGLLKSVGLGKLDRFIGDVSDKTLGKTDRFIGDVAGGASDYFMGPTRAARAQEKGAERGMAAKERMFDKSMATQRPWLEEGERHLRSLSDEVMGGDFDVDPGQFEFDYQQSPGYQFMMDEGLRGVERGAAARGDLQSGGTDVDMMRYAQGFAAQDYGNQYNRAYGEFSDDYNRQLTRQGNRYNRRAGMAGVGQTAAGNVSGMQMQQGQNLSSGYMNIGNAQANRAMGMQNTMNPLINLGAQGLGAYLGGL